MFGFDGKFKRKRILGKSKISKMDVDVRVVRLPLVSLLLLCCWSFFIFPVLGRIHKRTVPYPYIIQNISWKGCLNILPHTRIQCNRAWIRTLINLSKIYFARHFYHKNNNVWYVCIVFLFASVRPINYLPPLRLCPIVFITDRREKYSIIPVTPLFCERWNAANVATSLRTNRLQWNKSFVVSLSFLPTLLPLHLFLQLLFFGFLCSLSKPPKCGGKTWSIIFYMYMLVYVCNVCEIGLE